MAAMVAGIAKVEGFVTWLLFCRKYSNLQPHGDLTHRVSGWHRNAQMRGEASRERMQKTPWRPATPHQRVFFDWICVVYGSGVQFSLLVQYFICDGR